ncbi:MAG: hypothetical protein IPN33_14095 [Saprospiraceae bacterium]|nr:hypothetical protein [Saprospiraceae bacterium]
MRLPERQRRNLLDIGSRRPTTTYTVNNYNGQLVNQVTKGNWEVVRVENVDTKMELSTTPLPRLLQSKGNYMQ